MTLKPTSMSLAVLIPGLVAPLGLALLMPLLFGQTLWPNIALHSLLEGAGVLLNLSLAAYLFILIRVGMLDPVFNWASAGFLAMAIIGGFHGSVEPGQTFVGLHSLGVLVGGLLFGLMALPKRFNNQAWLSALPALAIFIGLMLSLSLLLAQQAFPEMLHQMGAFSTTAVALNLIGAVGFVVATLALLLAKQPSSAHHPLAVMTLLYAVAAVLFEYSVLWDATWWLWHFLRFGALALLLTHFFIWFYRQSERTKNYAEQMETIAFKDALTQLPNRALFQQQLQRELQLARRNKTSLALLFIDLDRFKNVNDTLGHEVGDQLLVQAAQRLKTCLRSADLLARMGGDEFTVILSGQQTESSAAKVAQNLIDAARPPYRIQNNTIEIGASIGIAFYPQHASDLTGLMRLADSAMYQAKAAGRNRYQIYQDTTAS